VGVDCTLSKYIDFAHTLPVVETRSYIILFKPCRLLIDPIHEIITDRMYQHSQCQGVTLEHLVLMTLTGVPSNQVCCPI